MAVLDEFVLKDEEGIPVANIDESFLRDLVDKMNARDMRTGDLSPLVLGKHTKGGIDDVAPESEQPEVVGYAKNWVVDRFHNTAKLAAFADFWILRKDADRIRDKYTRRSAEVWVRQKEVDPISLLGATTPARDLGLLKLSRSTDSITLDSPGDFNVPDDKKPTDTPKDNSNSNAGLEGKLDQILALLTKVLESNAAPATPEPDAAPGPDDAGGAGGDISDEELERLLGGGGDPSRNGDKPVPNAPGYPGNMNTAVPVPEDKEVKKLQRELSDVRVQLARTEIRQKLSDARLAGKDVNPLDEELLSDLSALPPDIRARQLQRTIDGAKVLPTQTGALDTAAANAIEGAFGGANDEATRDAVVKFARQNNMLYEDAFPKVTGRPFVTRASR